MKVSLTVICSLLLLSACASSNVALVENMMQNRFRNEYIAAQKADVTVEKECGSKKKYIELGSNGEKEKVLAQLACIQKIAKKEVRPSVVYKDLFDHLHDKISENINLYKKDKLTFENLRKNIEATSNSYVLEANNRIRAEFSTDFYQAKQQDDLESSQRWQAIAAGLNGMAANYDRQAQALKEMQMNRPIQTNCRQTYSGYSCTSY